jgi:hypothetical protein
MNLASKLGEDIAKCGKILLTESAYNNLDSSQQSDFFKQNMTVSNVDIDYYLNLKQLGGVLIFFINSLR